MKEGQTAVILWVKEIICPTKDHLPGIKADLRVATLSWSQWIEFGPLTAFLICLMQILQGLNFLHKECRIIHTDIKPDNILLYVTEESLHNMVSWQHSLGGNHKPRTGGRFGLGKQGVERVAISKEPVLSQESQELAVGSRSKASKPLGRVKHFHCVEDGGRCREDKLHHSSCQHLTVGWRPETRHHSLPLDNPPCGLLCLDSSSRLPWRSAMLPSLESIFRRRALDPQPTFRQEEPGSRGRDLQHFLIVLCSMNDFTGWSQGQEGYHILAARHLNSF